MFKVPSFVFFARAGARGAAVDGSQTAGLHALLHPAGDGFVAVLSVYSRQQQQCAYQPAAAAVCVSAGRSW